MNVLLAAATFAEVSPTSEYLERLNFRINQTGITLLITGVGGIATTYNLVKSCSDKPPDYIIQAGIAGSFDVKFPIGSVVCIHEEIAGDAGVEEKNKFIDLFDLGLMQENNPPFNHKILKNPFLKKKINHGLPLVRGISVNEITTRIERIQLLKEKFHPDVESMEGAAFHYVCLKEKIPFLQVRAISNYVGERNKEKWAMNEAIENLNNKIIEILKQI